MLLSSFNSSRSGDSQSRFAISVDGTGISKEGLEILEESGRVTNPEYMRQEVEEAEAESGQIQDIVARAFAMHMGRQEE